MTHTTARIKQAGKDFEIIVDLDSAIKFRKEGKGSILEIMQIDSIFTDAKKGLHASSADMEKAFGTSDVYAVAEKIVKTGEILLTQDYRDEEKEKKVKQVVDFLARNAVDPKTGNPHTIERIKNALEQAHVNIQNKAIESQIESIIDQISSILPIKIQKKRLKIRIPAIHTGKAYGLISEYKEKEDWLSNGDLEVTLSIPSGLIMDFYDKLNGITHGSALSEELKD